MTAVYALILVLVMSTCCESYTVQFQLCKATCKRTSMFDRGEGKSAAYTNRHNVQSSSRLIMRSTNNNNYEITVEDETPLIPKALYSILWLGLVTYAFTVAPGSSADAALIDTSIILKMISTPFDGTISPIFVAIFNALGILPAIYASLLLPGSKNQTLPALPFVVSSFALGFFGIGPYLAFRKRKIDVVDSERGRGSFIFENKLSAVGMLLFALYLGYYAISGSINENGVQSFIELFSSQRLVHVSTIDFAILSLAVYDPIVEDMKRRNWNTATAPGMFYSYATIYNCAYYSLTHHLHSIILNM